MTQVKAEIVNKPKFSILIRAEKIQELINTTLGDKKLASQFVADISTVVANNPKLAECDPNTVISAGLVASTLKLPMTQALGFCYVVPYGNKAQIQIGYKGYIQLAIRSGYYLDIDALPVRDGEYKGRDKLTGKPIFEFIENDDEADSKPIIGYRAYFTLLNGFTKTVYWSKAKVEKHRDQFSKSSKFGGETNIWRDRFDDMALKTLLRQLISKWGIMSVEMQNAIEKDQAVIKEDLTPDYVDNPQNDGSVVDTTPEAKKIEEQPKPNDAKPSKVEVPFPEAEVKKDDDLF